MRGGEAVHSGRAPDAAGHESFLAYSRYLYLKWAAGLIVAAIILYLADRPYGSRYGGSWAGYTLGIAAAALIVWLLGFGYRKRAYAKLQSRLVARLSAHVYLGVALLVVATLHTGFHFGWNVHTLAYALMCVAVVSGLVGVFCYVRYPRLMTANRGGMTMHQMLGTIATLDEHLRTAALPLDESTAAKIERAIEVNEFGKSTWSQLARRYADCPTAAAIAHLDVGVGSIAPALEEAWSQVHILLDEKLVLLNRVRRDIAYKTMLELWLHFHVPVSFMLLAALIAHVVSIFFLW